MVNDLIPVLLAVAAVALGCLVGEPGTAAAAVVLGYGVYLRREYVIGKEYAEIVRLRGLWK